jgi:hypothetical protein
VHAGELEALADDRFAAGLHDAGADEQAAGAEPLVAHPGRVVQEVAEFLLDLVFLRAFEGVFADCGLDAVDVAVVQVLQAGGEPFVLAARAISRRTFSTSAAASCRPTVLRLPADLVHKNRGPCPG